MINKIIKDLILLGVLLALLLFMNLPYVNLFICLFIILLYTFLGKGIKVGLGLGRPTKPIKTVLVAFALALLTVVLSYFLFLPIVENLTGSKLELGMFDQLKGNTSLLFLSLALGWVVGGFMEELIFRAFFIGHLLNFIPTQWLTVLKVGFSSILFGYLHTYQGLSGQFLTGFVGLILAIIYLANRKNIWLNIFTHGFINTISMLLLYFELFSSN